MEFDRLENAPTQFITYYKARKLYEEYLKQQSERLQSKYSIKLEPDYDVVYFDSDPQPCDIPQLDCDSIGVMSVYSETLDTNCIHEHTPGPLLVVVIDLYRDGSPRAPREEDFERVDFPNAYAIVLASEMPPVVVPGCYIDEGIHTDKWSTTPQYPLSDSECEQVISVLSNLSIADDLDNFDPQALINS